MPAAPLLLIDRFKRVFDDFKLKLPGPTQLLIDFYDALNAFYAPYWVWLIPLLLPLWLIRLDRDVRLRVAILMMLLAGLAVVWFTIAMFMPMFSLIEGMTSR